MSMLRVFRSVWVVFAVLSVAEAAFAQDVSYNAMPGINFAGFKTYKWVDIPGGVKLDQILSAQVQQAIDTELASKGLTKTSDETADLYVGYQAAIDQERQWNAYGGGAYRMMGGMGTATSTTISVGTLGVDIYDSAGKQLVWRGSATKTIDPKANPDKRQANIGKAVKKLLKNYPPPVKK